MAVPWWQKVTHHPSKEWLSQSVVVWSSFLQLSDQNLCCFHLPASPTHLWHDVKMWMLICHFEETTNHPQKIVNKKEQIYVHDCVFVELSVIFDENNHRLQWILDGISLIWQSRPVTSEMYQVRNTFLVILIASLLLRMIYRCMVRDHWWMHCDWLHQVYWHNSQIGVQMWSPWGYSGTSTGRWAHRCLPGERPSRKGMSWDIFWRWQPRWLNAQIVEGCSKEKGHMSWRPLRQCWSWS